MEGMIKDKEGMDRRVDRRLCRAFSSFFCLLHSLVTRCLFTWHSMSSFLELESVLKDVELTGLSFPLIFGVVRADRLPGCARLTF